MVFVASGVTTAVAVPFRLKSSTVLPPKSKKLNVPVAALAPQGISLKVTVVVEGKFCKAEIPDKEIGPPSI